MSNECILKIENIKYYLYESYILDGTGYTFRIYADSKYRQERHNCFWNISSSIIVIIGKKYNYMLKRKNDYFNFDIIKYNKNILKLEIENINIKYRMYSIFLNDDLLFSYGENDNNIKIWLNELRKLKLNKLENA